MKKGLIMSEGLIAFIIAIIAILLILKLVTIEKQGIESFSSREICKQSVQRNAELHIRSYNPPSTMINCPTAYLDFQKDKISYEYRSQKQTIGLKGSDDQKKEQTERIIADEIYNCYNQFGEGKLDLFGGPKKYCSVCSTLKFSDKDFKLNGYEFYGFLMKNTVPNKELAKEGVTYFDYMQGRTKRGNMDPNLLAQNRQELEQTSFDPESSYAVIFVYTKSEPLYDNTMEFIGKFWESNSGKVAVIGGAVLLVGGVVVGLTGIGAPAGAAMIVAGGTAIVRTVTIDSAVTASVEAYSKKDTIKDWTAFTLLGKYDEEMLKGLGCEELSSDKYK